MPSFVHPSLLWGLGLLALPVLIHLINMLRQRRVQWAAMEFLLASQKKNSKWIRLRELLLLLARMAAVAAVVFILAQPLLERQLALFGGARTHHIVLLDDTYSMSDRWSDTSAFDEARKAVVRLAEQAQRQSSPQTFTLLRFSRVGRPDAPVRPDLLEQRVDADFAKTTEALMKPWTESQLSGGLDAALDAARKLLGDDADENRVVYLVSDFRARDWEQPEQTSKSLSALRESVEQVYLVDCAADMHANLAITRLAPRPGARAAGVGFEIEATVQNFGGAPVRDVPLLIEEDGRERPAILFDQIAPGSSETRRFTVRFPAAGDHLVTARLPGDAVAADNNRHALVDVPATLPVLIVDGSLELADARYIQAALAPGGAVQTGISAQLEPPSFLNNNPLGRYAAIYLANIEFLDAPAITALEQYVRAGGGLAIFAGPATSPVFVNGQLYRDGEGLFPLPLLAETPLIVDRLDKSPDLEITDHPVLRIFAGERNSFLSAVTIDRYLAAPRGWTPEPNSGVSVLARLRNGAPLAVERKFGEGRVLAVLTTAAPVWNNWARNPSFVVAVLEIQSHLSGLPIDEGRTVGAPLQLALDPARYQQRIRVLAPESAAEGPLALDAVRENDQLVATVDETLASGLYEVQLSTNDDQIEARRFIYNVDASEGDLTHVDSEQLATALPGVDYEFRLAEEFQFSAADLAGTNVSDWLLYALLALLVGEQLLAYAASYHPPAIARAAR